MKKRILRSLWFRLRGFRGLRFKRRAGGGGGGLEAEAALGAGFGCISKIFSFGGEIFRVPGP